MRIVEPSFEILFPAAGHESVIEHETISVRIVCDRGVSHEITASSASYSQESMCNYGKAGEAGKAGEVTFILPCFWLQDSNQEIMWSRAMRQAEEYYLWLIEHGSSPQEARSVLPNSLKTELVMTCNVREWRHFFKLRTSKAAHPQMRQIARPMLAEFRRRFPVLFDDVGEIGD